MGIRDVLCRQWRHLKPTSTPRAGLTRGALPGHLGAWVLWDTKANPLEVFRVSVECRTLEKRGSVGPVTFTFGPAFEGSFWQSIEMPWAVRQFLTGSTRALRGAVVSKFFLSGGQVLEHTMDLEQAILQYRGRRGQIPEACQRSERLMEWDAAEVAALGPAELKAHSEKIKARLEEERLKEELARKAREAAEAAARAAAAAKASSGEKTAAAPAVVVDKSKPSLSGGEVAVFYGSSTGNTAEVAKQIQSELGSSVAHVKNVTDISPFDFGVCPKIILGIPTWHIGEMQDDWAVILPEMDKVDLKGRKMAIFGLGDGKGYPDTYVDAMQDIYDKFKARGAELVGLWPTEGYEFTKSRAIKDGKFLGLVIDVENQHDQTDRRVKEWCQQLQKELL